MKRLRDATPLTDDLVAAVDRYLDARKEGATVDEAARHELEPALRALFPYRGEPPAPVCGLCDDTGFRPMICDHAMRCGRNDRFHRFADETYEHTYVEDCLCDLGQTRRVARETAKVQEAARRAAKAMEAEARRAGRR